MPILWHRTRSVRVTIEPPEGETVVIENLEGNTGYEVEFTARRTMDREMGSLAIKVYNLPKGLRGDLEAAQTRKPDDLDQILASLGTADGWTVYTGGMPDDSAARVGMPLVKLEAGYDGQVSEVASVVGGRIDSNRADDTTYVTEISGEDALDATLYAKPTTVFPEGSPTYDLMNWLRVSTGLGRGNATPERWSLLVGDSRLDAPFYSSMGGFEPMAQLLDFLPLRWWIDDRELWIVSKDGQQSPLPPYLFREIGGGIRVPSEPMTERPVRLEGGFVGVTMLLWPIAVPGALIYLDRAAVGLDFTATPEEIARAEVPPGYYRIEEIEHSGSTAARGDFTTSLKLKGGFQAPIDALFNDGL